MAVLAISAGAAQAQIVGTFNGGGSLVASGEEGVGQPVTLTFTSPIAAIPPQDGIFSPIAPFALGTIQNITVGTGAFNVANFIQIAGYTFSLTNVAEGSFSPAGCVAAPAAAGQTCSPPGTPFSFTNLDGGNGRINTSAAFNVSGVVTTPTQEMFSYNGVFTAQFANTSFQQLADAIDSGGTIPVSYSLTIQAQANSTVPEPATFALMGSGLLALAGIGRIRRKQV